jgi:hypothetical protein
MRQTVPEQHTDNSRGDWNGLEMIWTVPEQNTGNKIATETVCK